MGFLLICVCAVMGEKGSSLRSSKLIKNLNQKFSLAIKLQKLSEAYEIAKNSKNSEKLKMVADLAIELGEFNFAEKAMKEGNDWNGLLLYYSSIQNRKKLKEFAEEAKKAGIKNARKRNRDRD